MPLRYFTAGESHGPGLTAVVEGFPAGVPIDIAAVNRDLARRMQGYGRGGRMKIEQDQVEIRSGVRWGESLGSPITLWIENRDWRNWEKKMSPRPEDRDPNLAVTRPRPGHADLTGALKYNHRDVRNVLERASAPEPVAQALMSVQAAKGVEIGLGFETARRPGSQVHDEIYFNEGTRGFERRTNNAGGTEGGMSSGEPVVVRTAFKPLSTLMSPLHSVDIDTKDEAKAAIERSDVVAIPAAAVIAEAVVAFVIADAFLEKFGGDSLVEIRRNLDGYLEHVRSF